jgi:hypothetical protein
VNGSTANYRSVLSSEREPYTEKQKLVRLKEIQNLVMGLKGGFDTRKTVGRKINFNFNFFRLCDMGIVREIRKQKVRRWKPVPEDW